MNIFSRKGADEATESSVVSMQAGASQAVALSEAATGRHLLFADVYRDHFALVYRVARRFGVDPAHVDDVVQEVFVVAHRRLASFEGRSSIRTWLVGITRYVVLDYRKARARKGTSSDAELDELASSEPSPSDVMLRKEAVEILARILDKMDDEKRSVFVLAELEQMEMPEIVTALEINLNTGYARLRAAREEFNDAVARHKARQEWGSK